MSQPSSAWLTFTEQPRPPDRKTPIFVVEPKDGTPALGRIQFYAPWRRFAFYPASDCVFEPTCLRDVAAFCDWLMAERKARRKAGGR